MLISNYILDGKNYSKFFENSNVNKICLEMRFISIPIKFSQEIEKSLQKFQIKIIKYIDYKYIKEMFKESGFQLPHMANMILNHYNENEVILIQKNQKKTGFFEKFFQLFS